MPAGLAKQWGLLMDIDTQSSASEFAKHRGDRD
jgi:hypothetical protein